MSLLEILIIAAGLAMDCLSVSVASGITLKPFEWKKALKMASFFGIFQAIMPILGWTAGLSIKKIISEFAPWIAFALLVFLGIRMIKESFEEEEASKGSPFDTKNLILLSIATSIDSLAAGISFLGLNVPILSSSLIIGAVSFAISLVGLKIGNVGIPLSGKKAEAAGGISLILIGAKIIIAHLK